MSGQRQKETEHERRSSFELRRRSVFRRYFNEFTASAVAGILTLTSGTNLNNLGGSVAMAQPRPPAEREDVQGLQRQAREAANAFRDYVISGDPANRTRFWEIYNRQYRGVGLSENREFMSELFSQMDSLSGNRQFRVYLDAYTRDRDRIWGVQMEPVVMTDFIEAVFNVRSRLQTATASDERVQALAQRYRDLGRREPQRDSDLARMRQSVTGGMSIEDAARTELERTAREETVARYGERLTQVVSENMPNELARRSVVFLREFMLSGDTQMMDAFRGIFDANTSQTFTTAFTREFTARIFRDSGSGLATVAQAYNTRHHGTDPNEFARAVSDIYRAAQSGNVDEIQRLRDREGADVVDPLLQIVARGMAGRAVRLVRDVLSTGSQSAADNFSQILGGRLAMVTNGTLSVPTVENNTVFWTEFQRLYTQEITQNRTLLSLSRSYQRNILPIALRDIYVELSRQSPNMTRLNSDYDSALVTLVQQNMRNLSWLLRPEADISTEITRRARLEDPTAAGLSRIRLPNVQGTDRPPPMSRAVSETYSALVDERVRRRALADAPLDIIEANFDSLGWLAGTPADVQRELDRRAGGRTPDPIAVSLRARVPTNGGAVLSRAYTEIQALRARRQQLVQNYGQELFDHVSRNLDGFSWLLRPVEDIESQMTSRMGSDQTVRSITRTFGFSVGTLSAALRDIYAELGRPSADRSRLEAAYGAELVQYVQTNRSNLQWLSGSQADIERELVDRTDEYARALRGRFYPYTPVQFVYAVARARQASSRGGIAQADARDSLGTIFTAPVAVRQAGTVPSIAPEAALARRAEIESRARRYEGDLENLRGQLRHSAMEPVRPLLERWITEWSRRNQDIRLRAAETSDPGELQRLVDEQQRLMDQMLSPADLRRSVEMAFAMIHLAETGGDLARAPPGATTSGTDQGTMNTLLTWYRGMSRFPEKQQVVGDVVSAVLRRADSNLYDMIVSMDEPNFFAGVQRTYTFTQRRGTDTRAVLVGLYGERFVSLMERQAPNFRFLDSPSITVRDLRQGENALYAGIVIRCYRAITNPQPGEDRETMVALFGADFVAAVEAQRANLTALGTSGANVEDVLRLPQAVRSAITAAYPGAYSRTVLALQRAYRRQDDAMFRDMGQVYAVLRTRPARGAQRADLENFEQRLNELRGAYGRAFVDRVSANMTQLGFLESPSARLDDMLALPAPLLEQLNAGYEAGPGAGRATFMTNFGFMADNLPRIFGTLRSSLGLASATDTLGTNFTQAVTLYRQLFGSNDYLFNQYINLPLFSQRLRELARRYRGIDLPAWAADGIDSPEELARFFNSEAGRQLIQRGREFYNQVETEYLQARQDANFHPTTGDYTDAAVTGLRQNLSILDALYMGIAIPEIGGGASAFNRRAAQAMMNSILIISQRDPYLVGPYLTQVLPAFIAASHDERTLVAAMEAFNAIFVQRYESGLREIAYSTLLNRQYFLRVFQAIGDRLPEIVSSFDHNQLEDELRLVPEPRTDEGYLDPRLYRYRPGWWNGEGLDPLPQLYGQQGGFPSLLPRPFSDTRLRLPVPGGLSVLSGADDLFSRMYDGLRPPAARMFRQRVPPQYRIGTLGPSTIIRRINELFGPMPINYSDYWLSAFGEAGFMYGAEGSGTAVTQRGGLGAAAGGRTLSGGARGLGTWQRASTAAGPEGNRQTTTTDQVDVTGQAAGLPYPVAGVIPIGGADEARGIIRHRNEFHYERADTRTDTTQTPGGPTTTTDTVTRERTAGLLETYSRIARQNSTDMLLFVTGEHLPELRDAGGNVVQQPRDALRSRLYFVTAEGNIYQLAYGFDSNAQLLNYLYGGVNTQQVLAGARTVGRGMLSGDSAAGGFDGAAVGFTVPRTGGDSFSALALGQLVRNMSTMDPVHIEQAVGTAVTDLVRDRRARDVYAAFYRGAQLTTVDPADRTHISDVRWATATGELMWRRMRIDPMEHQMELRVVGGAQRSRDGATPIVGARWRHEIPQSRYRRVGYGLAGAYNDIDLLREFRAVDTQADQIYARMHTVLASFYHWSEDDARDTGYLVAGSYMYARMEDWTVRDPTSPTGYRQEASGPGGNPEQHFASAMFMYWAQRHGILVGAQRVPGFSRLYERIDQAMLEIQRNPANEAQILQNLSRSLRDDLNRDIWRFSIAYGYDGERLRAYVVGAGQWTGDQTSYGNLYALFLFGRPTRWYADIMSHAYGYSPLVISENPGTTGGFEVNRGQYRPYVDLYTGFGILDWPSIDLQRYERTATVRRTVTQGDALRNIYRDLGSTAFDRQRLARVYGREAVDSVLAARDGLSWAIRPESEVTAELTRRRGQDDAVATQILNLRRSGAASAVIDIFTELRRASPDRARLERQYTRDLVDLVERRSTDLDWILLPQDRLERELGTRGQRSGSAENRIAGASITQPPARADVTGPELQRIFEQNMLDVLVSVTNSDSRIGLSPERYDVLLGTHLASPEGRTQRRTTYYVLHTPVADRPEARGSLVIGDDDDYAEWQQQGHTIGRGVTRVEVRQDGDQYSLVCSGDRRLRALTAVRFMGGVTLPLTGSGLDIWNPAGNWSVGGLLQVLQDHRHDLLAGAFYGVREYGNERWDQWTITLSHRFQAINTATMSDQLFSYVFFNRATRQVVFASDSVFNNPDELSRVCQTLSGGQCSDLGTLSRTTGGAGITWARADLVAGDRMAVHFFFEGGAEQRREFTSTTVGGTTSPAGERTDFIGRAGISWEYTRQPRTSILPQRYQLTGTAYTGSWPVLPGETSRPEALPSWRDQIRTFPGGWGFMLYGQFQW
ncbi:MAG TPA: hypothetical protein VLD37_05285 [Candidatus Bilamarchaeum sp.]|nr:hypothetical protein [Candidatus Bilamarchaeum sp.]